MRAPPLFRAPADDVLFRPPRLDDEPADDRVADLPVDDFRAVDFRADDFRADDFRAVDFVAAERLPPRFAALLAAPRRAVPLRAVLDAVDDVDDVRVVDFRVVDLRAPARLAPARLAPARLLADFRLADFAAPRDDDRVPLFRPPAVPVPLALLARLPLRVLLALAPRFDAPRVEDFRPPVLLAPRAREELDEPLLRDEPEVLRDDFVREAIIRS